MVKYIMGFSFTKNGGWGFGNSDFDMNHRIKDIGDLEAIGESIRKKGGYDNVTVLFFHEVQTERPINITVNADRNADLEELRELINSALHRLMQEG